MYRRSWAVALVLLATGALLYGASTHYHETRSVVLHERDVDPYRTPSFNVSLSQPDRVTKLAVAIDIADTRGEYTSTIRFNGVELEQYTRPGEHTVTVRPTDAAVDLQERNTLTIGVQQHFGVEPLHIDTVRVTATTPFLRWTTTIVALIGILLALFGGYTGAVVVADRYGYRQMARTAVRRAVAVVLTVAVVGTFFSFLNGAAFIVLEQPVAGPLLEDAREDVHTAVEHTLWEQYGTMRRTACGQAFRLPADCSPRTMEQRLADRRVTTYDGIDRYFRDAALLAYIRRTRAVAVANLSADRFEPAVSHILAIAAINTQYGALTGWTRSTVSSIIDRCRANGTPASRCFDRARTAFTTFDRRHTAVADPCRALAFFDVVNRSRGTSSHAVVATFIDIMTPPPTRDALQDVRRVCPSIGPARSVIVSEVARMAAAMSAAATYSASSTTRMRQATRQIGATMLREVDGQ